jgi:Tol biopolymer transport system component
MPITDPKNLSADGPVTGNYDLWLLDVRTGVLAPLTHAPGLDDDPVWSPDEQRLAFFSLRTRSTPRSGTSFTNSSSTIITNATIKA